MAQCIYVSVLVDAWEQCKDADVLLESPSAMAGVHIAEALGKHMLMSGKAASTADSRFYRDSLLPNLHYAMD